MTNKEMTRLGKLNAVISSINRVIDFAIQILQQSTTDDLKLLRQKLDKERKELIKK